MYRFEKTANHQKMLAAALVAMLAICNALRIQLGKYETPLPVRP